MGGLMPRYALPNRLLAVIGAGALTATLAACGSTSDADAPPSDTSTLSSASSSTADPVPEPSESLSEPSQEFATVQQYASVVAEARRDMEEYVGIVEDCALGYSTGDIACALAPLTFRAQTSTLNIRLSQDAKDDIRLLPPPPEIADLVARTLEVTGEIEALSEAVDECDQYEGCEGEWFALSMGASKVQDILDAWQPYI